MTERAVYPSIIGRPVYWKKDGKWRCQYRGLVFWVPGPGLDRKVLNQLADKAEQAMLRRYLEDAKRRAQCQLPK